ncbi:MAG TPA: hypothetical protein VFC95_01910 [Guyparkeria sp.]|nr:hypothetical protein [Guyparkeria sp.]
MSAMNKIFGVYELDGDVYEVRIGLKSKLQYETTARTRKWPGPDDAPFQAQAFWTWHAAKERNLIAPSMTYEEFIDQVEDVYVKDGQTEDDESGKDSDGREI